MHIHILGICGTFMGGLAVLARSAGHTVTGCDASVYPPMSTQLQAQGIRLIDGYDASQIDLKPDLFVAGNVVTRGNPLMEAILDRGLPYTSGPQWLGEHVLARKWVLAVAGTHGKTTTSSMLAWLLEDAGLNPGFLIGGVPQNFGVSARLTGSDFFVIEADEYDTAFFDKRSKFVHYRPRTAILNNLEFDHADIFADLAAIETQFHHFVRTIPRVGRIVTNGRAEALDRVLTRGCWSEVERFGVDGGWQTLPASDDASTVPIVPVVSDERFAVYHDSVRVGVVKWQIQGEHNRLNALAALAAARHAGVPPAQAVKSLATFRNVKRRMEVRGSVDGVTVYDDFAHHPTAIKTTIAGLRARIGGGGNSVGGGGNDNGGSGNDDGGNDNGGSDNGAHGAYGTHDARNAHDARGAHAQKFVHAGGNDDGNGNGHNTGSAASHRGDHGSRNSHGHNDSDNDNDNNGNDNGNNGSGSGNNSNDSGSDNNSNDSSNGDAHAASARAPEPARILAVLEPRSNTMKLGVMKAQLPDSLADADLVFGYGAQHGRDALGWDLAAALAPLGEKARAFHDIDALVKAVAAVARPGDQVLVMSNGSFGGIHQKLLDALSARPRQTAQAAQTAPDGTPRSGA